MPIALALVFLANLPGCPSPVERHSQPPEANAAARGARTSAAGSARAGSGAPQAQPGQPAEKPVADAPLDRARALFEEARVAKEEQDLALARAKSAEAIDALLSASEDTNGEARTKLLSELGTFAHDAGDLEAAKGARERVLEFHSRTLPDDHPYLQVARGNLALTIKDLGNLVGARALEEKVLEVLARTLPDDHPELQRARGNLAGTMYCLGDLVGAQALLERVLQVHSRTLPDDHIYLQAARANLAGTLYSRGDLAGARALSEKVLEVRSRTLPDHHPDLQRARGGLAVVLKTLGDLVGARTLQEKVLEVLSRTLQDDHPDLQVARLNLANTLYSLGDLTGARSLQERVLEVFSRTLPDDHPYLQAARENLAGTIGKLGDLSGARSLQEKVLEVLSRTLPDDHPDLQRARGNLAGTLYSLRHLSGARSLQERVLEVSSRTLADDHPNLLQARMNLAITLKDLGDLAGARAVLEKISRTLPDNHPDLQLARQNLAATMYSLGDLVGARTLSENVLEFLSRTLPDDHPDLQWARGNLAVHVAAQCARPPEGGDGEKEARETCAELMLALSRVQAHAVRTVLLSSPSREAEERCARLAEELDIVLSFTRGYGVFECLRELETPAFVLSESARGAAIASAGFARRASGSPKYAELRAALVKASGELAALAQKGTTSEAFDAARVKRERAERELIAQAREVSGGAIGSVELETSALSHRLGEHAASASFRRFRDLRFEVAQEPEAQGISAPHEVSIERMVAFVVRGRAKSDESLNDADSLTLVDLGPIEPIETAVREWREAVGVGTGRGIGGESSSDASPTAPGSGDGLRRLVLDPLLPALGERERIVLVLDDVLHLIPFDALPLDPEGMQLVGDRWRIETRATLGELWNDDPLTPEGAGLLAIGNVSYDGGADVTTSASTTSAAMVSGILRGGAWSGGFAELPGTGEESEGVGTEFERVFGNGATSTLLAGEDATKERLTELAPGARFIHVATHGWFAPESIPSWSDTRPLDEKSGLAARLSGEEQVKGMSPMLLCGLALAGANLPEDELGRAPGLVTADEIAALDLSGCELAVLSACDTNVGERRVGQGVASLQRALQMAGARTVITSLWKVPDEATKELMLDFYRRIWVDKKPKAHALWEAKKRLRDAKDERGQPLHTTRDWAAWVLTGDPR